MEFTNNLFCFHCKKVLSRDYFKSKCPYCGGFVGQYYKQGSIDDHCGVWIQAKDLQANDCIYIDGSDEWYRIFSVDDDYRKKDSKFVAIQGYGSCSFRDDEYVFVTPEYRFK